MRNFANGKIYYLRDDRTDEILYVGSTTKELHERMTIHQQASRKGYYKNRMRNLYDNIDDWDFIDPVLIEKYPCASFKELEARECEYIQKLKPKCNIRGAVKDPEKIKQKKREYHQRDYAKHKDKRLASQKVYFDNNKKKVHQNCKAYYEENKERILTKHKMMKYCKVCNKDVRQGDFSRHTKSKKHINNFIKQ